MFRKIVCRLGRGSCFETTSIVQVAVTMRQLIRHRCWVCSLNNMLQANCNSYRRLGSAHADRAMLSRYSDWLRARRPRGRSSSPGRIKTFLLSTSSRPILGSTQPPIQWVPGSLSPGVKRPECEADHSPQISEEVNKTWIHTSTPPYAFMAQCLIS
jgi:hypothetical protein